MDMTMEMYIGIGVAVLVLLVIYWIRCFVKYSSAMKYIKGEMNRSLSWNEYRHWKRELATFRWSFVPGLNPSLVKKMQRRGRKRTHSQKDKNRG